MSLPKTWIYDSIFPFPEDDRFEYKCYKSIDTKNIAKTLARTVCAFMNNGYGSIIIGIEDDSLKIKGVEATSKQIDTFKLTIDSIIGNNFIIATNGEYIDPKSIVVTINKIEGSNNIMCIVECTGKENTEYQLMNGEKILRLNASNYSVREPKFFSQHDIDLMTSNSNRKIEEMIDQNSQYINAIKEHYEKEINKQKIHIEEQNKIIEEIIKSVNNNIHKKEKIKYFFGI
uniref:Schlafen AlbA-2 domain-containing protein n=1 Tax=viral metagenome TaxID=1070528 RepID=A0A6C0AG22_9ZZZZ